jgi:hypothetical protein
MSIRLIEALTQKRQQVLDCAARLGDSRQQILQLLDPSETDALDAISSASATLDAAIRDFERGLDDLRITLATTGTTSGGKSSLANLLCGAEIMPVAVQEMSAGTVIIDHHPTQRKLLIPPIDGLPRTLTGDWDSPPDTEIKTRLQRVMDEYRNLREHGQSPSAPHIYLTFPTRIGRDPQLLGLPSDCKLRIIDLPGFKYLGDEHNRQIIRDEISPALCLLTYNSEEVDPAKQAVLLEEVVHQVREMRGSPARLLFIMNRIDAFRRDLYPQIYTEQFIQQTMERVRTLLLEALPEYRSEITDIRAQPLSTGPALYAHLALEGTVEQAVQSLERIDRVFHYLLPASVDDLPRRISEWKPGERRSIAEAVWQSSYADPFDKALRIHIEQHAPQLLLPHLLKPVADACYGIITAADQIAHAHVNARIERYEAECAQLERTGVRLQRLREESRQRLLTLFHLPDDHFDIVEELTDQTRALQREYSLPPDSLVPLWDWSHQLGNTIEAFLDAVFTAAIEERSLPDVVIIQLLPTQYRQELARVLRHLGESGYREYAVSGGSLYSSRPDERETLARINNALNDLASIIAATLENVLNRSAETEAERIQKALQVLFDGYATQLADRARDVAPDLAGVALFPADILRIKQKLVFTFVLSAGFPVHREQKDEYVGDKYVKAGTRRRWYHLWLSKEDIWERQEIFENRTYESAVIPSLEDIFSGFVKQAKAARHEVEFARWFRERMEVFVADIGVYQDRLLAEYRSRLDDATKVADRQKEEDTSKWADALRALIEAQTRVPDMLEVT